jgi:hypothetical protein
MILEVKKDANNNLTGTVDTMGFESEYEHVKASTHSVRKGLASELLDLDGLEDLNFGEQIVLHAMAVEELEMSSGIDLKKVRSITVYHFVEEGVNIGMLAIAEARDQDGKVMGSFMGGFLVAPCK